LNALGATGEIFLGRLRLDRSGRRLSGEGGADLLDHLERAGQSLRDVFVLELVFLGRAVKDGADRPRQVRKRPQRLLQRLAHPNGLGNIASDVHAVPRLFITSAMAC
jgi:hypothetical protein